MNVEKPSLGFLYNALLQTLSLSYNNHPKKFNITQYVRKNHNPATLLILKVCAKINTMYVA